jgi:acetolactate decarboxylase
MKIKPHPERYLKSISFGLILTLSLILTACSGQQPDAISQVSTIDALLAGGYEGQIPCRQLLSYGDFGVGTFDRLDGEMIILDGVVYQIKSDGRVYTPGPEILTPFANICRFQPDRSFPVEAGTTYEAFETLTDKIIPNPNIFYAIRLTGVFRQMTTRSVPAQEKPYPPLVEVTKNQSVFEMQNVKGTVIGFRCPAFVQGINVPGYHLHFLSADRQQGGHILGFETAEATCELDIYHEFSLILPAGDETFAKIDFSKNRKAELEAVEKPGN